MACRNHLLLIALVLLAPVMGAHAAERLVQLDGTGLAIDDPCARQVTIMVDATLHGHVAVDAKADHPEELDRLLFESRGAVHIRPAVRNTSCWSPQGDGSFTPTLHMVVRVPAAFPLSIDEPGYGSYAVGAVGELALDLSGAGNVVVDRVAGNATIDQSGSATVSIAQADMNVLSIDMSGAGSVTATRGRIGTVKLDASGAGQVRIGADIGDATVDLSGTGMVRFAKVSGSVRKNISGIGSVTVGDAVD